MSCQLWMMAIVGLTVGIGDAELERSDRPQRTSRQPAPLNYHMLLAEPTQHLQDHHSQTNAIHDQERADRRTLDLRELDDLLGSRHVMGASIERGKLVQGQSRNIIPVQHQPGVLGVPLEFLRGPAPTVPTNLPLGERSDLATSIGLIPVSKPAVHMSNLAAKPNGGSATPVTLAPMATGFLVSAASSIPVVSSVGANPQRVSIQINAGHDGRLRVVGLRSDKSQAFEALADRMTLDPSDPIRLVCSGAVEIRSRTTSYPALIRAARIIVNLNDGTIEVLPGDDR